MPSETNRKRSWVKKFADAFRGVRVGVAGQSSFAVHFAVAALVVACAAFFRVSLVEWCILLLCITVVLTAEMINSALEHLAREISADENQHIANALDIGSAAVLVAAIGASMIGAAIFLPKLIGLLT